MFRLKPLKTLGQWVQAPQLPPSDHQTATKTSANVSFSFCFSLASLFDFASASLASLPLRVSSLAWRFFSDSLLIRNVQRPLPGFDYLRWP